jgi:ribulose-5-phosphate 4-epimerase/fuculose-1-phosphate aldolase
LLPQLGALVWGHSPLDAVARAEALDYVSHLTLLSRQSGFLPDQ